VIICDADTHYSDYPPPRIFRINNLRLSNRLSNNDVGILNSLSHTRMSEQAPTPRVPIDELVRELRALPASAFDDTEEIRLLLEKMPVEEASLAPYLTWDRQHYTRNLIDKTDLYELIAVCWEVGQSSSVHNHRDQNCWMAAPIGNLLVENFRVRFQDIVAGECQLVASNTVKLTAANPCAVDPREPVHRVVNVREANQRAVTLHVYSRPFDTCVVYSPEQGTCGEIQLHYNTVFGKPATQ
jgi:cysteine dioxygenase